MPKKGLAAEFRLRRRSSQRLALKTVATFSMSDVATLDAEGRERLAEWIRHQAEFVGREGGRLATPYTARYLAR